MNIGIIGTGYVGLTTAAMLSELGHNVICEDCDYDKIVSLQMHRVSFYEPGLPELITKNHPKRLSFTTCMEDMVHNSDIIFLCVGTPSLEDGSPDTTYLESAIDEMCLYINTDKIIVAKSTVPIGTHSFIEKVIKLKLKELNISAKIHVISNPEFLKEGTAVYDTFHPDRIIIGYKNVYARDVMEELYKNIDTEKIYVDNSTAELIKYASNSFLALKISYINTLAQICDEIGANIKDIAYGIGTDHRISPHFFNAGLGFGGSCFGKDISALKHICDKHEINSSILDAAIEINKNQTSYLIWKMCNSLGDLENKKIGILGLSFKPETDDIRDAASLKLIEKLLIDGADISVHDPICVKKVMNLYPNNQDIKINQKELEDIAEDLDALILVTEWDIYQNLDWARIVNQMKTPYLFDGRNFLNRKEMENIGFIYQGIGV